MKKIFYFAVMLLMLAACKDEEKYVTVQVPENAFSFEPTLGGAIMHYKVPADPDVVGIHVRYKDEYGQDMLRAGNSASGTLTLVGFNEAQENVPATVSYVMRNKMESRPIEVSFSTLESSPLQFINSVEVSPNWNGFEMDYDGGTSPNGMAHVFYVREPRRNNATDTITLTSFPLTEGKDTLSFEVNQDVEANTVVVRVEDYRGSMVKERVWENVKSLHSTLLNPSEFEVIYNNSIEDDSRKLGLKYLTDGDTKGESWFQTMNNEHFYTFISNRNGVGEGSEPMYIDLRKMQKVANIRMYAHLNFSDEHPYFKGVGIDTRYYNMLPCSLVVYGCRDDNASKDWDSKNWEQIAVINGDPDEDFSTRWTKNCWGYRSVDAAHTYSSLPEVQKADPIYKTIPFSARKIDKGYRFLKIEFNAAYNLYDDWIWDMYTNLEKRLLSLQELEVYIIKE